MAVELRSRQLVGVVKSCRERTLGWVEAMAPEDVNGLLIRCLRRRSVVSATCYRFSSEL